MAKERGRVSEKKMAALVLGRWREDSQGGEEEGLLTRSNPERHQRQIADLKALFVVFSR